PSVPRPLPRCSASKAPQSSSISYAWTLLTSFKKGRPALAGRALHLSVGKIGIGPFKHPLEGGPFAVGHAVGFDRVVEAGVLAGGLAGHRCGQLDNLGAGRLHGE